MTANQPGTAVGATVSVGLEEGPDGTVRVHALDLMGCAAEGSGVEPAVQAFTGALAEWLHLLQSVGERVPPPEEELEIAVDEWIRTDARVAEGESDVCFEADLRRLTDREIDVGIRRLGDLRGQLLRALRGVSEPELDLPRSGGWTAREMLNELARAHWWTLSRLGASVLAEVPARLSGRLDTSLALVVDRFTTLPPEQRGTVLDLEGETWTPRKVLRRLLWVEWSLGRAIRHALTSNRQADEDLHQDG
jgi:predicted RNase H-like HicB family nuclease